MKLTILVILVLSLAFLSFGASRDSSINSKETPQPAFEKALEMSTAEMSRRGGGRVFCFLARSKTTGSGGGWVFHFINEKDGVTIVRITENGEVSSRARTDVAELPKRLPIGVAEGYNAAKQTVKEAREPCVITSAMSLQGAWHFDFVTASGLQLEVKVSANGESRLHRVRGVH